MSLMMGSGPFGHAPAGVFNADLPRKGLMYFEESPRRIRGLFAGETVVDSRHPKILHEHGQLPRCYFPAGDVRTDLLVPSDHTTHSPGKGDAVYWTMRAGGRSVDNAAWSYPNPPPGAPPLQDHIAFFMASMDSWLEEDEPMIGHVRDPYHRVDVVRTSRRVRVCLADTLIADSERTRVIFETGLVPRWYFPVEDVRVELVSSQLQTVCAYKGFASYYSVRLGGRLYENVAWTYHEPRHDAAGIADHMAFFNEQVELFVDDELQQHTPSPWSTSDWWRHQAQHAAQM